MDVINALDLEPIKVKLMHKESGEGWSLERANAIETEYRRFLFLMKQFPNEQTAPLVDVDTFWHYHILDTMKYAVDCDAVFGHFLHHFPYIGLRGEDDLAAHERLGQRMQELYEQTFGESYLRGAAHQDVAYSAAPGATAYSAAPGMTAYSAAPGVAANTAYSAAPGVAAKTAYSAAPGIAAQTAYSAAPGVAAQTAYSAAPGVAAQTAYSAAPGVAAKTAYSAAPGVSAKTAYSAAPGHAGKTAYSAAPGVTAYSAAPGKVAEGLQTAADAGAIIEQARVASFYSDRPRLTPSA